MDKAITIQFLTSLDSSFVRFLGILNHETRDTDRLSIFENLAKSLKDKELQIKNHDKPTANYMKKSTKKKDKFLVVHIEDSEDSATCSSSFCIFFEKKL